MIREIEIPGNWFGCVLVITFNVSLVFAETVSSSLYCFTNVYIFALTARYAIDNIYGGVCKTISDFNRSLGSCYFVRIVNERTSVASFARALNEINWGVKRFFLFHCHFGVT